MYKSSVNVNCLNVIFLLGLYFLASIPPLNQINYPIFPPKGQKGNLGLILLLQKARLATIVTPLLPPSAMDSSSLLTVIIPSSSIFLSKLLVH